MIDILYSPFLMQGEAKLKIIAGLLDEILTGPIEKANDLAFDRGARWCVGDAKRGIENQLI